MHLTINYLIKTEEVGLLLVIKLLLILSFLSLSISSEIGTSLSVRTPNDDTKPLDYELSIKVADSEGKFQYLIKRDWERELGDKYIDDIIHLQHVIIPHFYYGVDYVNKESKDINYTTYNLGSTLGWFQIGASFKTQEGKTSPLLNIAINHKLKSDGIDYSVSMSAKSNITDDNIINIKTEIKKWLTDNINIFGLYKHEYYNEKEDFQFKVGFGVRL